MTELRHGVPWKNAHRHHYQTSLDEQKQRRMHVTWSNAAKMAKVVDLHLMRAQMEKEGDGTGAKKQASVWCFKSRLIRSTSRIVARGPQYAVAELAVDAHVSPTLAQQLVEQ